MDLDKGIILRIATKIKKEEMMIEEQQETGDRFLDQIDLIKRFTDKYEFNLVLPGDIISDNEGLIQ